VATDRRHYAAIILTEGGEYVPGPQPDDAPVPPTENADQPVRTDSEPIDTIAPGTPPRPAPRPRVVVPRSSNDRPVLPDITDDERDVGWGDRPESDGDERLLREVPPHHGS
jgi:hypothetical protein